MSWYRVTTTDNIPLREGRKVRLGGHEIALFNLGDHFLAVDQRCPHLGGPLSDGIVVGDTVVCPLHAWKICLRSGAVNTPTVRACVQSYPTRVEDDVILIEYPDTPPTKDAVA